MATAKTTKTVANVNAKCDELENIVSRLEARIAELESNLNQDYDISLLNDERKQKVVNVLITDPLFSKAAIKNGLK